MPNQNPETTAEAQLTITRLFDAPRALVWKAWTEPEHFMRWWGPAGFTSPAATIDFRVGGKYLFCMRSPDGRDMWSTGVYNEIVPLERLVYTDSFADADGSVITAEQMGMSGLPDVYHITVTLEDLGSQTRMTLTHAGLPAGEMQQSAAEGWNQSFDKLAASLR